MCLLGVLILWDINRIFSLSLTVQFLSIHSIKGWKSVTKRERRKTSFLRFRESNKSSKFAGASSRQVHPRPRCCDSRWIRVEEFAFCGSRCDQTGGVIGVQTVGDVWYGTHGLVTNVTPEKRRTWAINPSCVINFTLVIVYPSMHRTLGIEAWSRVMGTGPGPHFRCAGLGAGWIPQQWYQSKRWDSRVES